MMENDVYKLYEMIVDSICELFVVKNKQYGNAFMKYGKVGHFIDMLRKWERFQALYDVNGDKIEFKGDSSLVIPTLSDIANYAIMGIIIEIVSKGYADSDCVLKDIMLRIKSGDDKV